ncbi:MAG: DUF1285 domain-containing protein [Bosea sp. (in: a-proteobacteria)]
MAREPDEATAKETAPDGLQRLMASLGAAPKGLPPIERWNPPFCGDIDMHIAADGQWFYMGTPIGRPALVRLFASVLKLEDGHFVLVTPVEKIGITVEDAPFQAVEMAVDGEGGARQLSFRTNVDDLVMVGLDNALRFAQGPSGGVRPYVHIRRGLWARVTRALTYDLLALGTVQDHGGSDMFGVMAGGAFYPVMAAGELEGLT